MGRFLDLEIIHFVRLFRDESFVMVIDEFVNAIVIMRRQRSKVDLDLFHRNWNFEKSVNVEF